MTSNSKFDKTSGAIEIAKEYSKSIEGKIALVTGASLGGIGEGTIRAFASGGASTIIVTGRSQDKLSKAISEFEADYPKTRFRPLIFDLLSLASARKAAQEILDDKSIPHVDITVANAGFSNNSIPDRQETGDGIEVHFAGNHLAHFLFINTLFPKIQAAAKKSPPGATRIVTVSSGITMLTPIRFSDWNYENKPVPESEQPNWAPIAALFGKAEEPAPYENQIAYAQSKTANILYAVELNKRFSKEGIYSFGVIPGVVATEAAKAIFTKEMEEKFVAFVGIYKNLDQGAATNIVAALDPGLKPEAGVILDDCQVAVGKYPAWSTDEEAADKLWKLSEDLVKEKLG